MRAVVAVTVLVASLLAGCGDQVGVRQVAYVDRLELARDAALAWNPAAQLVGAFAVERAPGVEVPEWLDAVPAVVRDAEDRSVGDALAPWWGYAFQSGPEIGSFYVSAAGVVHGPDVASTINEQGDDVSTAVIGQALDAAEVSRRLQDAGEWTGEHRLVTWELLHDDLPDPTVWIVRDESDPAAPSVLVVDAADASVLCRGTSDVTFGQSSGSFSMRVNAATPDSRSFTIGDGHHGLAVTFSGSDEPLNALELVLAAPSGQATTLTWAAGTNPTVTYLPEPEGGDWSATVRQTGGLAANAVVSFATDGSAISC